MNTRITTFSANSACEASSDGAHTGSDSGLGPVFVDAHIRDGVIWASHYPEEPGCPAFSTVALRAGRGSMTLYIGNNAQSLETATALRDALSKALRSARKASK